MMGIILNWCWIRIIYGHFQPLIAYCGNLTSGCQRYPLIWFLNNDCILTMRQNKIGFTKPLIDWQEKWLKAQLRIPPNASHAKISSDLFLWSVPFSPPEFARHVPWIHQLGWKSSLGSEANDAGNQWKPPVFGIFFGNSELPKNHAYHPPCDSAHSDKRAVFLIWVTTSRQMSLRRR